MTKLAAGFEICFWNVCDIDLFL